VENADTFEQARLAELACACAQIAQAAALTSPKQR
jgi:hypothetical protein